MSYSQSYAISFSIAENEVVIVKGNEVVDSIRSQNTGLTGNQEKKSRWS